MSRQNKVNPDHYKVAGRLSPDDLARERKKQTEPALARERGRARNPVPPWMAEQSEGGSARDQQEAEPTESREPNDVDMPTESGEAPAREPVSQPPVAQAKPRARAAKKSAKKSARKSATKAARKSPAKTAKAARPRKQNRRMKTASRKAASSKSTAKKTAGKRGAKKAKRPMRAARRR